MSDRSKRRALKELERLRCDGDRVFTVDDALEEMESTIAHKKSKLRALKELHRLKCEKGPVFRHYTMKDSLEDMLFEIHYQRLRPSCVDKQPEVPAWFERQVDAWARGDRREALAALCTVLELYRQK